MFGGFQFGRSRLGQPPEKEIEVPPVVEAKQLTGWVALRKGGGHMPAVQLPEVRAPRRYIEFQKFSGIAVCVAGLAACSGSGKVQQVVFGDAVLTISAKHFGIGDVTNPIYGFISAHGCRAQNHAVGMVDCEAAIEWQDERDILDLVVLLDN